MPRRKKIDTEATDSPSQKIKKPRNPDPPNNGVRAKPGPLCEAFTRWLWRAPKGETFTYFRGHDMEHIALAPQHRFTRADQREHDARKKRLKKRAPHLKKVRLAAHDPFHEIRGDVAALLQLVEYWELRGLIENRIVGMGPNDFVYEAEMLIQRNGLQAVRDRLQETKGQVGNHG